MMFRRALSVLVLVLLAGGCMDGETERSSGESLDDLRTRVVAEARGALDAVTAAGLEVEEAAGIAEYCQLQPDPGATYRTGARLAEDGDPADQVAAVREALVGAGWEEEGEGPLTKGDLRASVTVSRRVDEPGVTVGVTGPCVPVSDDYRLPSDKLRTDLLE